MITCFSGHPHQGRVLPCRALRQGAQGERKELLHRAEAAQRLQSCDCLRSRRMAADADRDAGLPVPRDSKLGNSAGDNADCDWFPYCPRDRVGL